MPNYKEGAGDSWVYYRKISPNRYSITEYWYEYDGDGNRKRRSKYMGTATEEEYQAWLAEKGQD